MPWRGATPLAELAGYGSTCDAYHRVQIAPNVLEPARAVELALADAGAAPEQVGYVNLHGTGTDLNDRLETAALKRCFGPRAAGIPMSATKSMIGHPQGAWRRWPRRHRARHAAGGIPPHNQSGRARPGVRFGLYPV